MVIQVSPEIWAVPDGWMLDRFIDLAPHTKRLVSVTITV